MNKYLNKFTSLTHFYKLLIKLISFIGVIKANYIILFSFILVFSAFFEITLIGFLYILLKAFIDPNYYQGIFLFNFFINFLDIKSNSEFILYLSIFFILICLIAGIIRILFLYFLSRIIYFFGRKITSICYQKILYEDYINLYSKNTND